MPPSLTSRSSSVLQKMRLGRERKNLEKWNAHFKELLSYRSEHGDCNVPTQSCKLGKWVNRQRVAYGAGSLAQDRIDRLSSIGFKWKQTDPETVPWETRFDELVQYKAKHGTCSVPNRLGPLGRWVTSQRSAYMAGSLARDRIQRLSSIGFKWRKRLPWETRFDELAQYKAKHGDCNVQARQGKL